MDDGVDNETRLKAYTWCQEYLGGIWKQIDFEEFNIVNLSLGRCNNRHYICSLPAHRQPLFQEPRVAILRIFRRPLLNDKREHCTSEPEEVLLRVYGEIFFEGETPLLDTVIFSLLSERKQAPRLYGVFREGRLEEYIPSRSLRTAELSDPHISEIIASKLASFHQLQLPLCKEPRWLGQMLDKWYNQAMKVSFENDDDMQQMLKRILAYDLEAERQFVKKLISESKSPVIFSHNDCQEGNILLVQGDTGEKNLILIDYEYSSYNYREFDIGNHFCEWTQNYCKEEAPYFELRPQDFPSREQQLHFIRSYLASSRQLGVYGPGCHGDTAEEEEAILREVKRFCPVSHFLFALWSVVQAKISKTTFGYMEYAIARFEEYFRFKSLLPLDMLPDLASQSTPAVNAASTSQQSVNTRQAVCT